MVRPRRQIAILRGALQRSNVSPPSPRHVALCITELDPGGAERCLVAIAKGVDRRKFEPRVFCLAGRPADRPHSLARELEEAGVEVEFFGARSWKSLLGVTRRLTRRFREWKPDVVQSFLFHANIVARFAARKAGVPAVLSGVRVAEVDRPWRGRFDRATSRWVGRYVCVSQSVADFCRQKTGLLGEKLVVIANGVDVDKFSHAEPADLTQYGVPQGRNAVVFVGRLHVQKGLAPFLRPAAMWLEAAPSHDLLLVGDGPESAALRRECQSMGIADRVHFAGWRPDVPQILKASSLLVLPSQWEGMPNAVLEAMAAGLPVVASDVEGVRELLGEVASEQTAPAHEPARLARRIAELLQSPDQAAQLGAANQARAREHFSFPAMIAAYERLWESMTASPAQTAG